MSDKEIPFGFRDSGEAIILMAEDAANRKVNSVLAKINPWKPLQDHRSQCAFCKRIVTREMREDAINPECLHADSCAWRIDHNKARSTNAR